MGGGTNSAENEDQKSKDAQKGFSKMCYYEILEIDKTATEKEIIKAYRKMSLKWHPDKNQGEDTTEKFQQINEAHQCLSDAQSRAWYDKNRDSILKGKDPATMNETDENYMTKGKMKPYFTNGCFKGFSPEEKDNFYRVYDRLFKQLDKEEELEEEVNVKHKDAPEFGAHYSCAEDVFAFYDSWQYFTTGKPFAYADLYDANQAPNRRVKRLIEIENKKERDKERRAFNETIRNLIGRLKDLDPRFKKFTLQRQQEKEEKRRKMEEEKEAKRASEAEKLRKHREELARQYAKQEEEALARGEVEIEYVEEFRCEICKKTFKSDKQMDQHLKSKKHIDAEKIFKKKYQLDDDIEQQMNEQE